MTRKALATLLAMVLVAAHLPLPVGPRPIGAGGAAGCCGPRACCQAFGACAHAGGCALSGAARAPGGFQLLAGGCHEQTPRVTPVQIDPTVQAPLVLCFRPRMSSPRADAADETYRGPASRPLVPPPRA